VIELGAIEGGVHNKTISLFFLPSWSFYAQAYPGLGFGYFWCAGFAAGSRHCMVCVRNQITSDSTAEPCGTKKHCQLRYARI
jgi:hypothetical protein